MTLSDDSPYSEEGTSRSVDWRGSVLHYHDVGEGEPIVFLHSWGIGTTAWITWSKVLRTLAPRFRCLLLDLPNFTRSGPIFSEESRYDLQASSATALMDALGLERAHIVGNSQGAQSALLLATRWPQRVDRLVVGAHHLGTTGGEYLLALGEEEGIRLGLRAEETPTPDTVRAYLECHLDDHSLVTDELIEYLLHAHVENPAIGVARESMQYGEPHDLTGDLINLAIPTLVIWGRNDRVCHVEIGIRTMNLIPDSRLIVMKSTGHWPPFERPAEYADHVGTFLQGSW
ncbi:alpha/beta fold hydrolase [Longivirga aurantiaca]|uniref:Alpha/beta fold hydrolase n=1 Tax=Longivirga aurantiaca TaxID=1837743 RepID=A0ABW1SWH5_9ACTN